MESNVGKLQRKVRCLQVVNVLVLGLLCALVLLNLIQFRQLPVYAANGRPNDLRVRSLTVVDDAGTPRVVISAPVPDPVIGGARTKREGAASGIIIYDRNGIERGGYLTSNEGSNGAMLTLDGVDAQVATIYANPDNGATISLNNQRGDGLTLTTWNTPVIQLSHKKKIFFKQAPNALDVHWQLSWHFWQN